MFIGKNLLLQTGKKTWGSSIISLLTFLFIYHYPETIFDDSEEQIENVLKLIDFYVSTVLDLCCGPGRCSIVPAKKGFSVTGVDLSPYLLEKARKRANAENIFVGISHSTPPTIQQISTAQVEIVPEHITYWKNNRPINYSGGPFSDRTGGLIIFETENIGTATDLIINDPFIENELIEDKWVKEWIREE